MPPRTTTFKVGDKVKILEDANIDDNANGFYSSNENRIATIKRLFNEDGVKMAKVEFDDGDTDEGQLVELEKTSKRAKRMNFIVIWDEDPCEFFATIEEAKEKAMELLKDEDGNDPHNIRIVEIKSLWTVEPEVKITKKY